MDEQRELSDEECDVIAREVFPYPGEDRDVEPVIKRALIRAAFRAGAAARAVPKEEALRGALVRAQSWIEYHPHGDNCYVSNHYNGDPGNRCNCGRESLLNIIEDTLAAPERAAGEGK